MQSNIVLICFLMFFLSACGGATNVETAGIPDSGSGVALDESIAVPHSIAVPLMEMDYQSASSLFGTGIGGTVSPVDIHSHYNLPPALTLNGINQTIAIVDAPGSATIANDLNSFSSYYKLPLCNTSNPCFQKMDLSNGSVNSSWAIEIGLDVEWAHAVAPDAKILLVLAKSATLSDLMAAIQTAANQPGVVAVTMSWGTSELSSETTVSYDGVFKAYQAKGITFIASSGDSGDNGKNQQWPATSPYVTTVGGTSIRSLLASAPPSTNTEIAWIDGGGGTSTVEPMPSYQISYLNGDAILSASKGKRVYPDIAYNADPNYSPVGVYVNGAWYAVGGTSAGAPQWGGIMALIANHRAINGKTTLQSLVKNTAGGFNGILYQTKIDSTSFFEITVGTDDTASTPCALCTASKGYDEVTGLGVPNVTNLLSFF
jgi:subtilase family serine protease